MECQDGDSEKRTPTERCLQLGVSLIFTSGGTELYTDAAVNLGLKQTSYLSQAFSQISTALQFVAPDEPIASFVNPSRLLTKPKAFQDLTTKAWMQAKGMKSEVEDRAANERSVKSADVEQTQGATNELRRLGLRTQSV